MGARYVIQGGTPLRGAVRIAGAKNAALPLLVAACLGSDPTTIDNVPVGLSDVETLITILQNAGADVRRDVRRITCARGAFNTELIDRQLAGRIRSSLLFLGMAAGLRQPVEIPPPGGCNLGERRHDLHLLGLGLLGHHVSESVHGISLRPGRGRGAPIAFYVPTTSGTENIMLAACLADGTTEINGAHGCPSVLELARLLRAMGANIELTDDKVWIIGVDRLRGGARVEIPAGWDETVTYIAAAAVTGGEVELIGGDLKYAGAEAAALRAIGVNLEERDGKIIASGRPPYLPFDIITGAYPAVGSDLQPIFAALAARCHGVSSITDTRYTSRFRYLDEIRKFGFEIERSEHRARLRGPSRLNGAEVHAIDLRGGAAVVLCALAAEGRTTVTCVDEIGRGYESFAANLRALGARIEEHD